MTNVSMQAQPVDVVGGCGHRTTSGGAKQCSSKGKSCCSPRSLLPSGFKRSTTFRTDWWPAIRATIMGERRMSRFVELWARANDPVRVLSAPPLPAATEGVKPFVLAVNHISGVGHVTSLVAPVLKALAESHADLVDDVAVVAGTRSNPRPGGVLQRLWRRTWEWAKARWSHNLIETLMVGDSGSQQQMMLRWRRKAARQPSLLFPEGLPRPLFGEVRPGSGTWLASLKQPVIPVAVWWQNGEWQVRFGEAIRWKRAELHDLQLGLAIAELMPPRLVNSEWRNYLRRREELRQASA